MVYKTSKETQEKKDLKRKHIIKIAARIFSQNGYHKTTVKDVVEAADISVGTFYFYFKNKEHLFETLYDEGIEEIFSALMQSLQNIECEADFGFSKAIAFFFKVIECNKPLAKIMLIEAVGLNPTFERKRAEATQKLVSYTTEFFYEIKKLGTGNMPDIKIFALAFIGTLYNVVLEWLQTDSKESLLDSVYALTVYNLQALKLEYNIDNINRGITEIINTKLDNLKE